MTAAAHLTVRELAARLHVKPKTILNWNSAGTGPRYITTGRRGRPVYPLREVEAWERARLQGGAG